MESMRAGRIVLVEDLPRYSVRFGILLNSRAVKEVANTGIEKRFKVLILTARSDNKSNDVILSENETGLMDNMPTEAIRIFRLMMYYSHTKLLDFEPEINANNFPSHQIIEVKSYQILELMDENIRVDVDAITSDINKREMPRFK